MASRRRRRDRLHVAILINQLATPGLGSWLAGRRVAGLGQMALAFGGFFAFLAYFGFLMIEMGRYSQTFDEDFRMPSPIWWQWSLGVVGIAWVWAGITSLQLLGELRARSPGPRRPSGSVDDRRTPDDPPLPPPLATPSDPSPPSRRDPSQRH